MGRYRGRHEVMFKQWEACGQPKIALKVKDEGEMVRAGSRRGLCFELSSCYPCAHEHLSVGQCGLIAGERHCQHHGWSDFTESPLRRLGKGTATWHGPLLAGCELRSLRTPRAAHPWPTLGTPLANHLAGPAGREGAAGGALLVHCPRCGAHANCSRQSDSAGDWSRRQERDRPNHGAPVLVVTDCVSLSASGMGQWSCCGVARHAECQNMAGEQNGADVGRLMQHCQNCVGGAALEERLVDPRLPVFLPVACSQEPRSGPLPSCVIPCHVR